MAVAGLAVATAAIAIGFGLAPWWAVIIPAVLSAVAGALLVQDPPSYSAAEANVPSRDSYDPPAHELIERIEHPFIVVDAKRRVELANAMARKLLGEHIVGQDVRLALRNPAAAALLTEGAPPGSRTELLDLGGQDQRWELLADPIGNDKQAVRIVDRTALRAAEKMRVDFVANASHELRTPLATLIGFIETLEGPAVEDADARRRFLAIMRGEAQRMIRLVDDLMSLSRIEADKHRQPTAPVALIPLAEEVRDALGHRLAKGERKMLIDAEPGLPPVAGDRDQLLQLLHNLVGNAIKYGRPGTTVKVRLRRDGASMVRLTVEDEGEGIAAEHLPRLTERFYRVDPGRSRSVGGTGLGLAIVKHIVERHRGQLLIDSEIGVGTRVTALLPTAASLG
ncbi:hypothetical protein BSL82_02565 [Tardibacter chloracetimidivorans]|uniref:histidine kinase n=2 Tax=Tardibacter chloracetimidivorans TaxID=1921510 RepID=A0A1L3ZZ42_9SPHN|nr:hypothetical protein BSL82_02565 [Tardibacter chloracetimidivorans]